MVDFDSTLVWPANYLLHSTVLLLAAGLLDATGVLRSARSREFAWRLALIGALATATLQTFAPGVSLAGQHVIAVTSDTPRPAATVSRPPVRGMDIQAGAIDRFTAPVPAQSQRPASAHAFLDRSATEWLLLAWLAGALVGVLRLLNTMRLAAGELRNREIVTAGELHSRLLELGRRHDENAPPPRLSIARDLPGPVSLPNGEICLPRWAVEKLPSPALDAVLAHELAHVRRHDPLVLLGVTLLQGLLFWQPLNRLAHRRLAALAELNADAVAAQLTGKPRALAQALAECATQLKHLSSTSPALMAGVAMATRRSPLVQRVERLLRGIPMRELELSRLIKVCGFIAVAVTVIALPAFGPARGADKGVSMQVSINETDDDRTLRIEIGRPGYFLHAEMDGKVAFNEAEDDVASLEEGATVLIREKRDDVLHELRIENDDGAIEREYARDGETMPMDTSARAWLAKVIPEILRNAAINVEARIARIHDRGGNRAVLDELALIESDHALAKYAAHFVSQYSLAPREADELIERLGSVGSDFELRNALAAVFSSTELEPASQARLLDVAASINSDFEAAELAVLVVPDLEPTQRNLALWRELVAGIGSDFEMRRAIAPLFERELPTAWRVAALRLAGEGIGSDFELRALLQRAAPHVTHNELLVEYLAALDEIGSDFEARQAVVALVEKGPLDVRGYSSLLDALHGIGSDFEQLQALQAIARTMPRQEALVQKYRKLANGLASHEQEQALRALN